MTVQTHPLLQAFFQEAKTTPIHQLKLSNMESGKKILKASAAEQLDCLLTCYLLDLGPSNREIYGLPERCRVALGRKKFEVSLEQARSFLEQLAAQLPEKNFLALLYGSALNFLERSTDLKAPELRPVLQKIQEHFARHPYADGQKVNHHLTQLLARPDELVLDHDVWGEWARHTLQQMPDRENWAVLLHQLNFQGNQPSEAWFPAASKAIEAFGKEAFVQHTVQWLGFLKKQTLPPGVQQEGHPGPRIAANSQQVIRQLLHGASTLEHPALLAAVAEAAIQCFKKVPGVGPKAPQLGTLAVRVLGKGRPLQVAAHLERVKQTIKQPTYLDEVDRQLNQLAQAASLTREQLAEHTVPTFDLQEGSKTYDLGTHHAVLTVQGFEGKLQWFTREGKALKSVPAAIKTQHKNTLQEIKTEVEDLNRFLSVYTRRLEGFYLEQWAQSLVPFQERYLLHPLLSRLCQKLIWQVGAQALFWLDGGWVDAEGTPLQPAADAQVTLWHPVQASVEQVQQWRAFMLDRQLTQPFKQAHREVYLLTAAEEHTHTYSNRFAAHILKQHTFHALCAQRGWHNELRLMVDNAYHPPHKPLSHWNLRAEFWVEGIGDRYGTDTTPSGSYLYLNTDQVRFYPIDAAMNMAHATGGGYSERYWRNRQAPNPLPLSEVPPLVFSEIMRDVDLFVGVCSVGNDPNWIDGGANVPHRDYWQNYSFGELSATAETRRDLLSRLIPRLKIREVAQVEGKFLKVQGQKRTYKIHLGSGNILMEPNDQYLCIVPDSSMGKGNKGVLLPFEGDRTLSIILSKAFLLAEDHKITDPTITRQL